jgi:hypothetical protein
MARAVLLLLATTGVHSYALGDAGFAPQGLHEYLTQGHIGCEAPDVSPGMQRTCRSHPRSHGYCPTCVLARAPA